MLSKCCAGGAGGPHGARQDPGAQSLIFDPGDEIRFFSKIRKKANPCQEVARGSNVSRLDAKLFDL